MFYYISHGKYSYIFMFSPEEQYPSFGAFIKLVILFDISVDQFIHADSGLRESSCHKQIDVLLNAMNEEELIVMRATAEAFRPSGQNAKICLLVKSPPPFRSAPDVRHRRTGPPNPALGQPGPKW